MFCIFISLSSAKQKITMKKIFRFLSIYLLSIISGMVLMMIFIPVFTDVTYPEMMDKLDKAGLMIIGISCVTSIVALFIAGILQVIIHEGGHLITGLLSKFNFVSFRVFNITLIKDQGKYKIKKFHIKGTGGQCLLSPPEGELKESAVTWYLAGGALLNLFTSIICFIIWYQSDDMHIFPKFFFMYMWSLGLLFTLMNGIPLKISGITNDGYNIVLIKKDKSRIGSFIAQLQINAASQNGVRLKDMPDEWFANSEIINYKNIFHVGQKLSYASRLIEKEEYETAHAILNEMYSHSNDIVALLSKEIACELLFIELYHYKNNLRAEELYTEELKKYIQESGKTMSSKQRINCIVAHNKEMAYDKSKAIFEETLKQRNNYLMQGEVAYDLEVMRNIVDVNDN